MIPIPATISKLMTMADKGIRIVVDTQELTPEAGSQLFSLKDSYGHFIFIEGEVVPENIDVPEFIPDFRNERSPAQRFRAVVYRLWEQKGKPNTSEQFYREEMEKIIQHYKDKLD